MRKGGYKIVDFKGAELSSTVVVRPGIYSQIIDDYDKTILVSGVSLGGTLKDDSFASVSEVTGDSGDSVDLGVYGGIITVTEDDEVTFALSSTPAELDDKIGDLDDLETTDKDSLVDAVNEVKGEIGDLDDLETTDKSSLVSAINDLTKNTMGTSVDIKDYTSSNKYVTLYDGYVSANSQLATTGAIRIIVQGSNDRTVAYLYLNVTGTYQSECLFVRKGMKIYVDESTATGASLTFNPLN